MFQDTFLLYYLQNYLNLCFVNGQDPQESITLKQRCISIEWYKTSHCTYVLLFVVTNTLDVVVNLKGFLFSEIGFVMII